MTSKTYYCTSPTFSINESGIQTQTNIPFTKSLSLMKWHNGCVDSWLDLVPQVLVWISQSITIFQEIPSLISEFDHLNLYYIAIDIDTLLVWMAGPFACHQSSFSVSDFSMKLWSYFIACENRISWPFVKTSMEKNVEICQKPMITVQYEMQLKIQIRQFS